MKADIFRVDCARVRWKEAVHQKHHTIHSRASCVYRLPADSAYLSSLERPIGGV